MNELDFSGLFAKMPPHIIEKAKEAAKRTLEDIDVRMFLEQYDLTDDADFIQRNMSRFREYIKVRDTDEWYSANLKICDHNVMVEYIPRNERLAFRLMSGHSLVAKAHYDATTESFRDATVGKEDQDLYNAKAYAYIKRFIDAYSQGQYSKGMWLVGAMGIGKTHLMGAFTNRLVAKNISVRFLSMNQLIKDCHEKIKYNSADLDSFLRNIKTNSEVLIFDDLGTEPITNWSLKTVIYDIFDYRMNNKLPTFVTSNLTIMDYINQVRQGKDVIPMDATRLEERLTKLMTEVQMGGRNRRKDD
ncbi:AFG1/ZapE family ATPase [Abiotrophia defectiva]|uniref:AFG1/ZapE family ATPase n=1 Tax=Abiotrophia defectiva TaxID=46125 RepID=UPI0028D77645|nr:AFG1/ZapE family ATPase [Abiotrophia defectiva]